MLNSIWTPILIASLAQTPSDGAKPPGLPDSPAFHEPGVKIVTGEQLEKLPGSGPGRGRNLWVAVGEKGRRVIVRASVCRKDAFLEEFMCLKNTKEHESILTADIHPKTFHAALILAGAEAGSVAKFQPKFKPPTGDKLDIWIEWKQGKETKRVKAQEWIREGQTKKAITHDFVFAGSGEIKHPVTGESYYLGNEGDLISVSNFASSVIDLAVQSSNVDEELSFQSFAERIPPEDTEVFVILQPVRRAKDRDKGGEGTKGAKR
ncbi:MAG: hypothetical protein HY000_11595 [Planctomycetes bacterium]|nr:hypothetical protein [Planctomycetota bacterium]